MFVYKNFPKIKKAPRYFKDHGYRGGVGREKQLRGREKRSY